jgi:NAD(P)-dependent dehydrogenase (short-subunit alcohol dehydrogenase family)
MRLQNKVAIVTGAAGNIGLATVELFLEQGAKVMMVDRDQAQLDQILAKLGSDRVAGVKADVTNVEEVMQYVAETTKRFGKVDIFFNNAGIEGPVKPIEEYSDDGFEAVMNVNVTGVFFGLKHVMQVMNDGGSIIMTSSVMGLKGSLKTIGYTASKHAVVGLMRSAARGLAAKGIRVNTIHPGYVEGDMMRRIESVDLPADPEESRRQRLAAVPMGKYVQPRDIAETVLFLSSDESRMVTGQTLIIDGGFML